MKKKILSIALVVCLLATALVSGTLAYFTETEQQTNEFTIGNIDIDLWENAKHKDGLDQTIKVGTELGKDTDENPGFKYENIMPGDTMEKVATVENNGDFDAYVALVIKHEGYLNFNQNVDDYYEPKNEDMQKITDDIFPGWNLLYDKTQLTDTQLRYTIKTPPTSDDEGVEVLGVGYAQENQQGNGTPQYHYRGEYFKNVVGGTAPVEGEPDFFTISDEKEGEHDRVWIVYLKMAPGAEFTMDLTTVCPDYFDNNSVKAFNDMVLDVKAFAIQAKGLEAKAAFAEALKPGFDF